MMVDLSELDYHEFRQWKEKAALSQVPARCDCSAQEHKWFCCGYQRGMEDYGDARTDIPDVQRMQALEQAESSFGYNVELSAWGMEYESPWFPTLRQLADWLIDQNTKVRV